MQNTGIYISAALASLTISFFTTTGAIDTAERVATLQERQLRIVSLSYSDGLFSQSSHVSGAPAMPARWTAEIKRGSRHLCSGGGDSVYQTDTTTFTPSEWAGDECPDIMPGDTASASWEWKDTNGFVHVISKQITIKDNQQ